MRNQLRACISSVITREEGFQDYRFVVKTILERFGIEGIRNFEDVRNQGNFNAVLQKDCNLFILLIGEEDSKLVREELNIALARGLPTFVFIKEKRDKDGRLIDPPAVKKMLFDVCPELYENERIYFYNAEDLAEHVEYQTDLFIKQKLLVSPIIGLDPPVAYNEGIHLIQQARRRIVLVQRTSIFLLGPREGKDPEIQFYNALMNWLETKCERRDFIHYFSWDDTQAAINSGEYDISTVKKRVATLINRKSLSGTKMQFRSSSTMEITPHVVGDSGLGLNFWIGDDRYYLFLPSFMTKERELEKIIASVQVTGQPLTGSTLLKVYSGNKLP